MALPELPLPSKWLDSLRRYTTLSRTWSGPRPLRAPRQCGCAPVENSDRSGSTRASRIRCAAALHQLLSTDAERTTGGLLDNAVHVPLPFPSLYAIGKDASSL